MTAPAEASAPLADRCRQESDGSVGAGVTKEFAL